MNANGGCPMNAKKNLLFVTGHKNPDTDSIVSAIAYAHLKNELGEAAVACRLGELSDETEYLMERFGFDHPMLLKDARATLDEITVDLPTKVHFNSSIKDAMAIVSTKRQTLAVVDDRDQLLGVVTSSNLADIAMGDTAVTIELLKRTSQEALARAIDGHVVYESKEFNFNGKTSIGALNNNKLENYDLEGRLVILGDDDHAQEQAIVKGAACLVLVWTEKVSNHILGLAAKYNCSIITSTHGTMNTSRYLLFSPSVKEVMATDLVSFNFNEFVDDVGRKMSQTRFRSYPVTDDKNRIYGFISRYHILNSNSKQLILVDHNEYSQSVEGIEDADVFEVIDHHRIGGVTTVKPINFRNEIIGSTASIITKIYQENNIEIPKDIASILLAAIISDTLNLKSPTTTQQDVRLVAQLEEISGLDRFKFAHEMYEVTSSFKSKSYEEIINQDVKKFYISEKEVMVSQVVLYRFDELYDIIENFEDVMEVFVEDQRLDLLTVVFTSIEDNGSIVLSAGALKDAVSLDFPQENGDKFTFLKDVVSRKNQILPRLSNAIERFMKV